jgi:hypothetical protein
VDYLQCQYFIGRVKELLKFYCGEDGPEKALLSLIFYTPYGLGNTRKEMRKVEKEA